MIIGYGRVKYKKDILSSSYDCGYKEGLLKSNGANETFIDIDCPEKLTNRVELNNAIDLLKEGDVLMVASQYDSCNDIDEFYKIYETIKKKGAILQFATPIYRPFIKQK